MSDSMQRNESEDWNGWEAVEDEAGNVRHRPVLDHDGQPFMAYEDGAPIFDAAAFPPNTRILPHPEFYSATKLRFVPLAPWELS